MISVVICTYNRAELLKGCLDSLAAQTADPSTFEVLVIDNNSNDGTYQVVEGYKRLSNLRLLREEKQGLSHARNRGIQEAKGDYIAYLDDDVLVPPEWLKILTNLILINQPSLDGLGGPLFPFYTTAKPSWYEDEYAVQMGTRKEPVFLKPGQSFIGANMIWNKNTLESIKGFRPEFGYVGNLQTLGEETDAYNRIWDLNPNARFLFSPELHIEHWVPPEKMTLSFRLNRYFNQGLTNYRISAPVRQNNTILLSFTKTVDLIKQFGKAILSITKYDRWQKWVFCELAPVVSIWGEIRGILGLKLSRVKDNN